MIKKVLLGLVYTVLLFGNNVFAAATLKVGVLAPEGTNWSETLKKMAKEIDDKTGGEVKFKFYFGGSQGDEPDVLRKVRVGQLNGGIFTGKTLGDIYGDVRVMELPFTFEGHREKALKVMKTMAPYFDKGFEKNQFVNFGFFEIGLIYFVSQKKTETLDNLKGLKIWSWEGDDLVNTMISELNLVSVPLPLPDVLSSLSTGIVEAAYAPPLGMIALQWNTKIKYVVDFPLAYSVGAFLVNSKSWQTVPDKFKATVKSIAEKYVAEANINTVKDNIDSLAAIKSQGVQFLKFPEKDLQFAKQVRGKVLNKLKGKMFSPEAITRFEKALKETT